MCVLIPLLLGASRSMLLLYTNVTEKELVRVEEKGWEGKERKGKGRNGKGREGKGSSYNIGTLHPSICARPCV